MFSANVTLVPTVTLTPPSDQVEANWQLSVTVLSLLFLSLSPSELHSDIQQASSGRVLLIHHEAGLQFPDTVLKSEKAICMHSTSWVISYLSQRGALFVRLS